DNTKSSNGEVVTGGGWLTETDGNAMYGDTTYRKRDLLSFHYGFVQELFPVAEAQDIASRPIDNAEFIKLSYSSIDQKWYHSVDANCYFYSDHRAGPGLFFALGVQWTAPEDGRVDISQSYVENYSFTWAPGTNGVRVAIILNGTSILYPDASQWRVVGNEQKTYFDLPVFNVHKGDQITFILDANGDSYYDICTFDITVRFAEDGEDFTEYYNNYADFFLEDEDTAWSYVAVNFVAQQGENVVDPLPVVPYLGTTKKGCGATVNGSVPWAVCILSALAVVAANVRGKKRRIETHEK
ncbi:MAG: hypothetical protein K2L51_04230, partial [Clostridiales bacterium]|nr:hypothetical protein [Clostridiales bacterium]